MKTVTIKISPKVLKWARESLHLPRETVLNHFSQISKKRFKFDDDLLSKIETGTGQEIKFTLLQELSVFYKRPLAIFFLNEPPNETPLPNDRRTIDSNVHNVISSDAILTVRRARYIQEIFRDLSKELNISLDLPFEKISLSDNSKDLAQKFRDLLKFDLSDQKKAKDSQGLFNLLRVKLERANIFTLKSSFPLEDARAFSLVDQDPFIIIINNKDYGYAPKCFSLIHEFAHILLRESAICNDFERSHLQIEKFCNAFAASFLVPDKYFWEVLPVSATDFDVNMTENYINKLKKHFLVSKDVLLRKFLSLNLISDEFYKNKCAEWQAEYENREEVVKDNDFFPGPGLMAISTNGRRFVEMVLHARGEGKITVDNAADFIGVSLKYLPEVERLAVKPHRNA
jgi:Zn-dependent peptidase ImmA (M78 family)